MRCGTRRARESYPIAGRVASALTLIRGFRYHDNFFGVGWEKIPMKIILREDVDHVGKMGELVTVADGYARNFLLPRQMAAPATEKNVRALDHQKRLIEAKRKKERAAADELVKRLAGIPVTIPMQAGEEDKLFGSVTSKDIADALAAADFVIDKRKVLLDKPIKTLGTFMIPVRLASDVTGEVRVSVVKQVEPA